ncbi:MAG: rhamnulokinase [Candidatus Aminicenantes bacterium]|nr:rhamnulokinase [Candidatus Aminicenantes bacterium]
MRSKVYLAIDLGAESGRILAGLWDGAQLKLVEIHRFPNKPILWANSLRWDVLYLWKEILSGLALAAKQFGDKIISLGIDTWGVDFVLLSKNEEMICLPYHYRDERTRGMMAKAFRIVPKKAIFRLTGIQFMPINTLYQLLAFKKDHPELLSVAATLLMMPDFFHWLLCGHQAVEYTIGTTSQCFDVYQRKWSKRLLKAFDFPMAIFPDVVFPGTYLGLLKSAVREKTGLSKKVKVVTPAAHDTASAVVAVPTKFTGSERWAYLSSGTWSLMGVETKKPNLSSLAFKLNMTNEGGLDGTYRLLKNIMGLWLIQQSKRSFEASGRKLTYAQLVSLAKKTKPFQYLIDPDDSRFLNPPDMVTAIKNFCWETDQCPPQDEGELIRCIFESLALKYREVLNYLERLTGNHLEVIHLVGGGARNSFLNQLTADACQRPVVAGPFEATAMGNLLVQLRADKEISSLEEIREASFKSTKIRTYWPGKPHPWEEAAARLAHLLSRKKRE